MENTVSVLPAAHADKPVVARLLQLCLHDLSEWTSLQIGPDGSFDYLWLDLYWTSPRRHPYMIRQANAVIGFALVREKEDGENADWDFQLAEFFILRSARRQGAGRVAARHVLSLHAGIFEISYDLRNRAARAFWTRVVTEYNPSIKPLPVDEHRERFRLTTPLTAPGSALSPRVVFEASNADAVPEQKEKGRLGPVAMISKALLTSMMSMREERLGMADALTCVIRQAIEEDLNALLDLYRCLHPDDPALEADAPATRRIWQEMVLDRRLRIVVADVDGKLVSSCTLVLIPNLTRGMRPYGIVENVVTDAAYRKRGLATGVLRHALDEAWRAGCYKVMLSTGSKQDETLRFYEAAGFRRGVKTGFVAYARNSLREAPQLSQRCDNLNL